MIARLDAEWLDTVAALPESELPVDRSTIAFAVRLAVAYRAEAEEWQRIVDDLIARLPDPSHSDNPDTPDTPSHSGPSRPPGGEMT